MQDDHATGGSLSALARLCTSILPSQNHPAGLANDCTQSALPQCRGYGRGTANHERLTGQQVDVDEVTHASVCRMRSFGNRGLHQTPTSHPSGCGSLLPRCSGASACCLASISVSGEIAGASPAARDS